MSDALPLPPRPNLEQYKKLAKDFKQACRSRRPWFNPRLGRALGGNLHLQERALTPEARREIGWDTERVERQWHSIQQSHERTARCTLAHAQFFLAGATALRAGRSSRNIWKG